MVKKLLGPLTPTLLLICFLLAHGHFAASLPWLDKAAWWGWSVYISLSVAIIAALLFRHHRYFMFLVLVGACYLLQDRYTVAALPPLNAVVLMLNLFWLSLLSERGIISVMALMRWLVISLQLLVIYWSLSHQPQWLGLMESFIFTRHHWLTWLPTPQFVYAFAGLLLALRLVIYLIRPQPVQAGWVGLSALLLFMPALHDATSLALLFLSLGLVVVIMVIMDLHRKAYLDELSGLPGRRALMEDMQSLGSAYTVAMLDVDHFKKFNDTYGHDIGDQVLRFIATKMEGIRGGGRAYRYGGEEFTFLFPGKRIQDVIPYLDEVRERIATSGFALRGKDRKKKPKKASTKGSRDEVMVTVSIGVAEPKEGHKTAMQVLKLADQALYRAKEGGRNKVAY